MKTIITLGQLLVVCLVEYLLFSWRWKFLQDFEANNFALKIQQTVYIHLIC